MPVKFPIQEDTGVHRFSVRFTFIAATLASVAVLGADATAPSAPTGLMAIVGDKTVSLNWTAATGATSYNVYRGRSSGNESKTALATGLTSPAYKDSSVTNGTTYFYKVTALNGTAASPQSDEVSAKPAAPPLPAAPSGLTATAGNQQVVLAWSAVSDAV